MKASKSASKPNRQEEIAEGSGPELLGLESELFREVTVRLQARLGDASLSVEELLALKAGSVLSLDRQLNEDVELYLNETLVGRGEIVAVDDQFAVRLTEVAKR